MTVSVLKGQMADDYVAVLSEIRDMGYARLETLQENCRRKYGFKPDYTLGMYNTARCAGHIGTVGVKPINITHAGLAYLTWVESDGDDFDAFQ